MNRLRKWWVWLFLALLAVLGAFGLQSWMKRNGEPAYRTTRIEKGPITASVAATGTLSPVVSVQVGSQVSGQLSEILADFNSEVKQGQLIARIDPQTFEYRVRQAQADLEAARSQVMTQQANIAAQRAEVLKAEVNAADAQRDLELKQQLMDKGYISASERDKARAVYNALAQQVNTAKAQAAVAAANARNAEAVVRQREAALAQSRIDLARTEIRAPVNGVVIKRSVERGQTVAASLQAPELFVIAESLADMQVDTAVDESEIGRIHVGQKASFTVDAFPGRQFEGTVKQIRKAAQNVSNVVTYTVVISASNPNLELLPGMTANVRVVTDQRDAVLKVANAALRYRPPGAQSPAPRESSPVADAQNGAGNGQGHAMRERLVKELQLSEVQQARLDPIFSDMRKKMMAAREAPEEERGRMIERSRNDVRAQVMQMLTPEQQRKYEQIAAESGDRRGLRGRIYSPDEKGQPRSIEVRLGLSDGTMTEVISAEVKEGMEIIIGAARPRQAGSQPGPPLGPRLF